MDKSPAFIINQFGFTKDNVDQHITAPDASTLVLNLDKPAAESFLLYCLSAPVGSIVQKKAALANQQDGDFGYAWIKQHSAGSGPFTLRSWKASESIILEKNPHFQTDSKIQRVIMKHITDPAAQLLMLQKGDVDIARDLTSEQLRPIANDPEFSVIRRDVSTIMLMSCNTTN